MTIPRYAQPGTWSAGSVALLDAARNFRFYSAAELTTFGQLGVSSSPADTAPPNVTSIAVSPSFVDTALGPQTVQTTLDLTDDLSGVSFAPFSNSGSLSNVVFISPSGAQGVGFAHFGPGGVEPSSGTPLSGVWNLNVTLPQFSEPGTWTLRMSVKDDATNRLELSTAQLAERGLPSSIIVVRPSLATDGSVGAGGGTITDETFGARAALTVPPGVFPEPTDVAIDVLTSPPAVPLPTGFSSAESYFVNVQLTPQPVFPLAAPGISVVLPLRDYVIPGTAINLFRVDPATAT